MSPGKWAPVCPMSLKGKKPARCLKARCAWWVEEAEMCAVPRLIYTLTVVLARSINQEEEGPSPRRRRGDS